MSDTATKEKEKQKKRIPVQDWVSNWLITRDARLEIKTGMVFINGEPNSVDLLLSKIILDADRVGYKGPINKIKCALDVWRPAQIEMARKKVIENIEFNPSIDDAAIVSFLKAVTGKDSHIDVAVIKHFIWQVKRKLLRMKVGNHIMPIFFGKTNAGKTEAVRRLLSPIYELYKSPQDMTVIKDERSSRILYDCHCIFFDEMARATAVDVNRLKNIISSEDVSYRPMTTNTVTTLINNATFIGATNTTLIETIYDPTSMRRFWQIDTMDLLDRDLINSLPYQDMWRSTDPCKDSPVEPFLDEIQKIQHNEFRNLFPLEDYLTNYCKPLPELETSEWIREDALYNNFITWLKWQNLGKFAPTLAKFRNGFKYLKFRKDGETFTYDLDGVLYKKKRTKNWMIYNIKPETTDFTLAIK